jgi:flagellar biosynthesis protein
MSDDTQDSPGGRRGRPVAVALQWDPDRRDAPTVTAKGEGALAEQILRVAFDRGVKVRTDADLAEVLRASELDREIPYAAFAAVAEILAYIYRANAEAGPATQAAAPGFDPAAAAPRDDEDPR